MFFFSFLGLRLEHDLKLARDSAPGGGGGGEIPLIKKQWFSSEILKRTSKSHGYPFFLCGVSPGIS